MYPYQFNNSQHITQVNGENGANMYALPANSSAILMDSTAPLIWVVTTDGAGYKTVTPFEIKKYEPAPQPNYEDIMARLASLEDKLNDKSNIKPIKSKLSDND